MKRCTTCNRTYTDESLLFCADDGTQLVSEAAPAEPFNAPPSSQPTIAFTPPPPASSYQPTPKKKKWLAVIALAFGLFAVPFLLYSLSRPLFYEYGFRNLRIDTLFLSFWGVVTIFGILLTIVSVIAGIIALAVSFRKPTQYGGRLLAVTGPVLSLLLLALVFGVSAFRRMQGSSGYDINIASNSNDNSNDNSNYNWNRSNNDNPASNSNSSSTASNSTDESNDSTDMSETDKYRLFYAAAKSGDTSLQQRAAKKVGIVDSGGMPTSTYQSFTKGLINWAFTDSAWVQTIDTPAKGRAYAEARL